MFIGPGPEILMTQTPSFKIKDSTPWSNNTLNPLDLYTGPVYLYFAINDEPKVSKLFIAFVMLIYFARGSITLELTSSFIFWFSCFANDELATDLLVTVESKPVKQEVCHTAILSPYEVSEYYLIIATL